jgi:hypothetical protein
MYLFFSSLGLNPIPTAPMSYFLTAAHSQVRLTLVSGLSFPGLVGRAEHCHLPFFFRSVWLSLFYHHDWKVGHEILSVGTKVSSSIWWCRSTALVRVLILRRWPHTFYVDHSHLSSNLVMRSRYSSLAWREDSLCQILPSFDQESLILLYWLAASCNCWFFIAKAYQVIPCLIILWSLIVPPSLKPIPDLVHLNSLLICAPLAHHVARLYVTSLFGFTMWVTSLVRPPLLILGILAYPWTQFPLLGVTALSLKRHHHEQAFSGLPRKLCLIPCARKTQLQVCFWLVDKRS